VWRGKKLCFSDDDGDVGSSLFFDNNLFPGGESSTLDDGWQFQF